MRDVTMMCMLAMFVCSLSGCGDVRSPAGKAGPRVETTETTYVHETRAARDIAAGTTIEDGKKLFESGPLLDERKAPPDSLLWSRSLPVSLTGKKVVRALRKGEAVKQTDISEADGSAFKRPGK